MKKSSTHFLRAVIALIGIGALAFVLWAPQRNAQATLLERYFNAFVAYTYVTSIPFFVALFQAFKLLGYVGRNETFSLGSVRALRTIRYCALVIVGLVAVSAIFMIGGDREDRPGGVFMRILVTFPTIVVATAAAICERVLQNAVDIKSENDLTV